MCFTLFTYKHLIQIYICKCLEMIPNPVLGVGFLIQKYSLFICFILFICYHILFINLFILRLFLKSIHDTNILNVNTVYIFLFLSNFIICLVLLLDLVVIIQEFKQLNIQTISNKKFDNMYDIMNGPVLFFNSNILMFIYFIYNNKLDEVINSKTLIISISVFIYSSANIIIQKCKSMSLSVKDIYENQKILNFEQCLHLILKNVI